jgi:hypothetical protein
MSDSIGKDFGGPGAFRLSSSDPQTLEKAKRALVSKGREIFSHPVLSSRVAKAGATPSRSDALRDFRRIVLMAMPEDRLEIYIPRLSARDMAKVVRGIMYGRLTLEQALAEARHPADILSLKKVGAAVAVEGPQADSKRMGKAKWRLLYGKSSLSQEMAKFPHSRDKAELQEFHAGVVEDGGPRVHAKVMRKAERRIQYDRTFHVESLAEGGLDIDSREMSAGDRRGRDHRAVLAQELSKMPNPEDKARLEAHYDHVMYCGGPIKVHVVLVDPIKQIIKWGDWASKDGGGQAA